MANYGALKTLLTMLQGATSITSNAITIQYGEELISANDAAFPRVTLVPVDGTYDKDAPGYDKSDFDEDTGTYGVTNLDMMWPLHQRIELWCWAFDRTPNATAIDHANATENLRAAVLQAFWDQRPGGLYFEPIAERWERAGDAVNRYGRALVMTVAVDVTVGYLPPEEVEVEEVTLNSVTVET